MVLTFASPGLDAAGVAVVRVLVLLLDPQALTARTPTTRNGAARLTSATVPEAARSGWLIRGWSVAGCADFGGGAPSAGAADCRRLRAYHGDREQGAGADLHPGWRCCHDQRAGVRTTVKTIKFGSRELTAPLTARGRAARKAHRKFIVTVKLTRTTPGGIVTGTTTTDV